MSRARIVDANLNRACEGLRVLEDVARFALEDGATAGALRGLRHRLRSLVPADILLEARDADADPGGHRTQAGPDRRDLEGVVLANARRSQEALRVLEEFLGKGTGRLEVYTLEKTLLAGLRRENLRARVRGVYAILDPELCSGAPLDILHGWLDQDLRLVQLRDKRGDGALRSSLAQEVARVCRAREALFLVNDDPGLALACGADGVHLGDQDLPAIAARRILGGFKLIGRTVRSVAQAQRVVEEGADYVAVGRLFPSASKPEAPAATLDMLAQIKAAVRVPVVAIGGISAENQDQVLAAGADAMASISAVSELLKRAGEKASSPASSFPS